MARSDSDPAEPGAIRAGVGSGVMQAGVARRDGLIRAVEGAVPVETRVVVREALRAGARVRLVLGALVAAPA